jgi:hypothetical protein
MSFLLVFAGTVTAGFLLVVYGTFAKNRWGINLDFPKACPSCHTRFPTVRKPASLNQVLWGGATCTVCGMELDKWGRVVRS